MPGGIRRLIKKLVKPRATPAAKRASSSHIHYQHNKHSARAAITARVSYWSKQCDIPYGRIAIRNQKRRWGSCSSLGNLNFNYKLFLLPPCLSDYVIVHELCHLRELNHGPKFWALVAAYYPAYAVIEKELRQLERATGLRPAAIMAYVKTHECELCKECLAQGGS